MTITLTPELEAKIAHRAKICNFDSPEQYIAATVDILDGCTDEQIVDLIRLRSKIQEARADVVAGRVGPFDNPEPSGEQLEPRVPTDLRDALEADPIVEELWRNLTPIARMDFMSWIDSAKQSETRIRRIEKACSMLAAGKRRPCCYSVVPFDLCQALAAGPMAKAQWSKLTSIERRDLIGSIESAKQPETRRLRIEQVCSMLAAGQQR